VAADPTIGGHPALLLEHELGPPSLITVCAECGAWRTILFLSRDRWLCTRCRAEGVAAPKLYPIR
jgi:hypothetical protein